MNAFRVESGSRREFLEFMLLLFVERYVRSRNNRVRDLSLFMVRKKDELVTIFVPSFVVCLFVCLLPSFILSIF